MISRAEARELVKESRKYSHVLLASNMMRRLAYRLGENILEWEMVGLLHDLDIDETRHNRSQHGVTTARMLQGRLPEHCLYAIRAHDFRTGCKPRNRLDKALRAVDSLSHILVKEISAPLGMVNAPRVSAELKRISLRRPWHKTNILKCMEIGLSLHEFLETCLDAYKEQADL